VRQACNNLGVIPQTMGLPCEFVDFLGYMVMCRPVAKICAYFSTRVAGEMSTQLVFLIIRYRRGIKAPQVAINISLQFPYSHLIFHHGKEVARLSGGLLPKAQFKQCVWRRTLPSALKAVFISASYQLSTLKISIQTNFRY